MSLLKLPDDVLIAICNHLCPSKRRKVTAAPRRNIRSLCLTSKRLHNIATPSLYHKIAIGRTSRSVVSLLRTLYHRPDLRRLVRYATVYCVFRDNLVHDEELVYKVLKCLDITLPAPETGWVLPLNRKESYTLLIIALLPELERLHYLDDEYSDILHFVQAPQLAAIQKRGLTSLVTTPPGLSHRIGIVKLAPSLERLTIFDTSISLPRNAYGFTFPFQLSNLVALDMRNSSWIGVDIRSLWQACPALTRLACRLPPHQAHPGILLTHTLPIRGRLTHLDLSASDTKLTSPCTLAAETKNQHDPSLQYTDANFTLFTALEGLVINDTALHGFYLLGDAVASSEEVWDDCPDDHLVTRLPKQLKSLDLHRGTAATPDGEQMAALRDATLRRIIRVLLEHRPSIFLDLELVRLDGKVIFALPEAGEWPLPLDIQNRHGYAW